MRHWWVNQNQTYRHEVQGGYLWSPKRNANGARNPFYESMREAIEMTAIQRGVERWHPAGTVDVHRSLEA